MLKLFKISNLRQPELVSGFQSPNNKYDEILNQVQNDDFQSFLDRFMTDNTTNKI